MSKSSILSLSVTTFFTVAALGFIATSPGFAQETKTIDAPAAASDEDCCCADEPEGLPKELVALNQLTGKDVLQARLKQLLAHPAEGKKLVAAALPFAKKKNSPINYNAATILARVARAQKNLPAGEAFYKICVTQATSELSEERLLNSYSGLCDLYFDNRKYADCAKVCTEVLQFKTDERAVLLVTRNERKELVVPNEPEEEFDPTRRLKTVFIRMLIQATAKQPGKVGDALEMVDKLLDANDHWILHQLKGQVLHTAGKYADAIKAYDDALEKVAKDASLSAEDAAELKENYTYVKSSIYIDMGKTNQAVDILEQLLKAKPNNAGYLNDLGYILADSGQRLEEAEKMCRKALKLERENRKKDKQLDPEDDHDSGAYLDSLGWVLFKEKKLKEAKEMLLKAVEDQSAQHIEIYDHLGDVHEALGEHEAALAAWRKGVEVASDSRRDLERKAATQKKIDNQDK